MALLQSGLPFLQFQMGFFKLEMRYIWGTFLFRMRYIHGGHYFPTKLQNFTEQIDEIRLLYKN